MKLRPADAIASYCLQRGYPAPEFEVRFHPARRWRLDVAWPAERVGLEFHGAVWTRGRHVRGKGFTADREKINEALLLGWRVFEVTTGQVGSGEVFSLLDRVFGGKA